MIERAANLQARKNVGTDKETDVDMVSVVFVIDLARAIDSGPHRIAGAVLKKIVQSQLARGKGTVNRDAYGLRRQQTTLVCELQDQGPVDRS